MHLREVHMENFKSFGRKLVVPFEPGFTAITGPNGSGKSNIGDAILFVLGPNSPRAIRAGRLTDLIFNGGEHGKGAAKCVVSLVFDNGDRSMPVDADLVTLTRKVKRKPTREDPDGYTSYFYVNGRASRKREFVDLLQHARISADGYNITQQGDVLQICRMSNMERRRILDDIAGVTAFDKDIDTADRRREDVQANLERIQIVLEEIAGNLARLEREKESAQKYHDLKQRIGRLRGLMAWRRRQDLEEQLAQVQQQVDEFTARKGEHENQIRELDVQHKEQQARFAEVEEKIRREGGAEVEKIQEEIRAARDKMVRIEEKINYARSEIQEGTEDTMPLEQELKRVRKELARTEAQRGTCAQEAATAKKRRDEARSGLERVRERISHSDKGAMELNRELARLKHDHEAAQTELHEARLEGDRLADRIQAGEATVAEATRELEALETDRKEADWRLQELEGDSKGSGAQRKKKEKALFDLRREQAELTKQAEDLENRIRRLQRELAELRAQQDAAARLAGGLGHAVQEVLAARDSGQIRGIIGTITELADAKPEHQEALQTAAGPRMQAVVVEDDGVAAKCIEMLKQARAGRATFLPLSKLAPGRPRGQALMKVKQEGCLGFALDLIDFNQRYQNAFWQVFGDTLVAQDLAAGRRMMGGVRIVTLEGELFESGGAMTGGAHKKKGDGPSFGSSDRGRLDALVTELADAESAQEKAGERLVTVRGDLQALQEELDTEGRQDVGAQETLKDLQKRRAALQEKCKDRAGALEAAKKALEKARATAEGNTKSIDDLVARLETMEQERRDKGQMLLKGTKKELADEARRLEREAEEATVAHLEAEKRREVADTQAGLVAERVKELEKALDDATGGAAKAKEQLEALRKEHAKAKAAVEALLKMEKKATGQLSGLHDEKDRVYRKLVDLEAQREKVSTRIETQFGLITNAKAKVPALEEALGEARVELKENPVEVAPDEDVPPFEDLRREQRNAETALDRLGAVNMRALEEFEEASKRKADLDEEVARLEAQREELQKLVAEITTRKKTALMEVFEAINENFAKVYARLSMGGKALMELEDPEDPFQAGLILKAQPMGKRVTRLDALSGGEKSLTSMAFIFAIQMYDPSPFYYFDEVDQNLDAVNSELLSKLIRDNARFAQFIVVSLRKITLKEASHIYGVTQQTPGQSEIIANFDIDLLRDEDKPDGHDGDDEGGDADGDAPVLMERPSRPKENKETTLGDVVAGLVGAGR